MLKINNHNGFSLLEAILVLIILILIAALGIFVHNNSQKKVVHTTTSFNKANSIQTKTTKNTYNYKGWLSLCSKIGKLCIKYPPNWTLGGSDTTQYAVTNPSGTVEVLYFPGGTSYGYIYTEGQQDNGSLTVLSKTPVPDAAGLYMLKTIANIPQKPIIGSTTYVWRANYFITTQKQLDAQNLKVGQTNQTILNVGFINPNSGNNTSQVLGIVDPNEALDYNSQSDATNWLSSPDVNLAAQILASTSYN